MFIHSHVLSPLFSGGANLICFLEFFFFFLSSYVEIIILKSFNFNFYFGNPRTGRHTVGAASLNKQHTGRDISPQIVTRGQSLDGFSARFGEAGRVQPCVRTAARKHDRVQAELELEAADGVTRICVYRTDRARRWETVFSTVLMLQ